MKRLHLSDETRYPRSQMAILPRLPVDGALLDQFCHRWKIARLELFGSARLDFAAAHDVDLLVSFSSDAEWSPARYRSESERTPERCHSR